MPRLPHLPDGALRIFGRVDRFHCECPRCGELLRAYFGMTPVGQVRRAEAKSVKAHPRRSGRQPANRKTAVAMYNPLTQRLTCPRCKRRWGVGLLLYPVGERTQARQPYDTQPTWPQLLALRQTSTIAYMVDKPLSGSDSVNILVEGECTCEGGRINARCPVHGSEEQLPAGPERLTLEAEIARLTAENKALIKAQQEKPGRGGEEE
jgi:hypothetical protein